MKININETAEPTLIKAHELPRGSIGKVIGGTDLYVIHTKENGTHWLKVWTTSNPPSIEAATLDDMQTLEWDVKPLPNGTKLTIEF